MKPSSLHQCVQAVLIALLAAAAESPAWAQYDPQEVFAW